MSSGARARVAVCVCVCVHVWRVIAFVLRLFAMLTPAHADVDEQSKNEIKEILLNYDRNLLVAGACMAIAGVRAWRVCAQRCRRCGQTLVGASPRSSVVGAPALASRSRTVKRVGRFRSWQFTGGARIRGRLVDCTLWQWQSGVVRTMAAQLASCCSQGRQRGFGQKALAPLQRLLQHARQWLDLRRRAGMSGEPWPLARTHTRTPALCTS